MVLPLNRKTSESITYKLRYTQLRSDEAVSLLCASYVPVLAFNRLNILLRHLDNLGRQIESDRGEYTCIKKEERVSIFEPL